MKTPTNNATTLTVAILSVRMLVVAFQPRPMMIVHHRSQQSPQLFSSPSGIADAPSLSTTTEQSFVSPSYQVYIEDTDAYGVIYNANYLRAYERALHKIPIHEGALADPGWFVVAATEHRFKGSPPLGGEFVIGGELVERTCNDDGGCVETWKCEMTSPPSENDDDSNKPKVYNAATITIASSKASQSHVVSPPFNTKEGGSTVRFTYEPYRDEFDPTLAHRMPIRNVLNLFERARSDYLGGPKELQRMQEEDGIVWVVTGVDECELCNLAEAGWEEDQSTECSVQCNAGEEVTVKTNFVAKRGGMVLECMQTLLVSTWDETLGECRNRRLAQGVVTIMALDANSRRPTRKIPAWFLEKISGDGGLAAK